MEIINDRARRLFLAIRELKTPEELENFFADAFSMKELEEMTMRFAIAEMLYDGKVYSEISKETGTSSATISRVNRALRYGEGGYKTAILRLHEAEEKANGGGQEGGE